MRVAILPKFELYPEHVDAFIARVKEQQRDCLALEPGCEHFDILRVETDASTVHLYEIYADARALELHRTYDHYKRFKEATEPHVKFLDITHFELVD